MFISKNDPRIAVGIDAVSVKTLNFGSGNHAEKAV
jgi:hypothetical protein